MVEIPVGVAAGCVALLALLVAVVSALTVRCGRLSRTLAVTAAHLAAWQRWAKETDDDADAWKNSGE